VEPGERRECAIHAAALFNGGEYWLAHEALERIWRSLPDGQEALVLQGLIQASAALLHQTRGNRHGVDVVGNAALGKLNGPQLSSVEFETVAFHQALDAALRGQGPIPLLELRNS
jgi:hypothetical protein